MPDMSSGETSVNCYLQDWHESPGSTAIIGLSSAHFLFSESIQWHANFSDCPTLVQNDLLPSQKVMLPCLLTISQHKCILWAHAI